MLYAAGAVILGVQLVLFSPLARAVGVLKNVLPMSPALARFLRVFTLERGILLGLLLWLWRIRTRRILGPDVGACASRRA